MNYGMVFKGLVGTLDDGLVAHDGTFKEGLSVCESLVLLLKVGALGGPVASLTFLSLAKVVSGGNDLLSDLAEEIEDLDDLLVVDLGGELSKGGDQGLEKEKIKMEDGTLKRACLVSVRRVVTLSNLLLSWEKATPA